MTQAKELTMLLTALVVFKIVACMDDRGTTTSPISVTTTKVIISSEGGREGQQFNIFCSTREAIGELQFYRVDGDMVTTKILSDSGQTKKHDIYPRNGTRKGEDAVLVINDTTQSDAGIYGCFNNQSLTIQPIVRSDAAEITIMIKPACMDDRGTTTSPISAPGGRGKEPQWMTDQTPTAQPLPGNNVISYVASGILVLVVVILLIVIYFLHRRKHQTPAVVRTDDHHQGAAEKLNTTASTEIEMV